MLLSALATQDQHNDMKMGTDSIYYEVSVLSEINLTKGVHYRSEFP
jgi:hypothetical protein